MAAFLPLFKAELQFSRIFSYTSCRRLQWLLSTEAACWLSLILGVKKIMQLKEIKVDWTAVVSALALQAGCYFPLPLWRDQNCVVFSRLMLSSELLQPSWAPPHTQQLSWALSSHAKVEFWGKTPLCAHLHAETHLTSLELWSLTPNHLCLQHHWTLTWKIHLTASLYFRGLTSVLKMGSISLISFTAFEN